MTTAVKGDRSSKQLAVDQALDQAFFDRVSWLFARLCAYYPNQGLEEFMQGFQKATDKWNEAKAAIEAGVPEVGRSPAAAGR